MKKFVIRVLPYLKKIGSYSIVGIALIGGFFIGRYYKGDQTQKINLYAHTLDINDISIAVNESNELILIERDTGKYIVYSDEVGMTIFKMYTNRIYQKAYED